MENKKYTVRQIFHMLGDSCVKTFTNEIEAEEYADNLAESAASFWVEFTDHDEDDGEHRCGMDTGDSKEIEFSREYCGADFDTVRSAIRDKAVEIIEVIVEEGDE